MEKIQSSFKSLWKISGERHSLHFNFENQIELHQGCFPSWKILIEDASTDSANRFKYLVYAGFAFFPGFTFGIVSKFKV